MPDIILEEMPSRERTSEFRTTAKSMQMKQASQMSNGAAVQKAPRKLLTDSIQFNQMSKRIGRDLSQTCAKLEKLSELARRGRSLFDDRQWEIDELTQIIQQDIHGMNQQIGALQAMRAEHSGTHRAQDASHSKSVVVGLQSRLAGASQTFKRLLESRTQALRAQKSRRDQFSTTTIVPSSMPPSASSGYRKRGSLGLNFAVCVAVGSVLLADDLAAQHGAVAVDMSVVERSRQQQQMLLMDEQQSYAQARADTMLNIESNISELGQIFKQLANLVAEQGETIQRIDMNVEETSLQVESAHMELLKYFKNISKNRWLAVKVFGTLIVFFIIFIVFLA